MGLRSDLRRVQNRDYKPCDDIIEIGEEKIREAEAWKSSALQPIEMLDEVDQALINDALQAAHDVAGRMNKRSNSEDDPDIICILQEPPDSPIDFSTDNVSDLSECAVAFEEIDVSPQVDEGFEKEADQLIAMLEDIF